MFVCEKCEGVGYHKLGCPDYPMTTTPPPEGTTEPRWACGCPDDAPGHLDRPTEPPVECVAVDRDERCLCPGGPASHRPSPPAPAAEDDAVAAYTVEERHWKRRAEAAEAERLRERVGEVEEDRDDWVQVAGERAERETEAREQVADLRARIERVEALTEGLLTAEGWNDPEVDTVLLIQRRYRAVLAGSGDVESSAPNVATSEGRDKAVATSGEQPGEVTRVEIRGRGYGKTQAMAERVADAVEARGLPAEVLPTPAPVVPDSAGLRERLWEAIVKVRDAAPRLPDDADTDDIVDAVLAVGGQGVTAEPVAVVERIHEDAPLITARVYAPESWAHLEPGTHLHAAVRPTGQEQADG